MSLAAEYRRQRAWRAWPTLFAALPPLEGRTVFDLGCGVGDQSADLVRRGARVVGVDLNEELLRHACERRLRGAEFRCLDLRAVGQLGVTADGIWSSFAAAYFPDLSTVLAEWMKSLAPGGWIALVEIDDLFGHRPLPERSRELLSAYAADALRTGRYDFHMGRKLSGHLEAAGCTVARTFSVPDAELSLDGPVSEDVLDAWRLRFDRMKLLQELCGPEFPRVREDFLRCLAASDHRAEATVQFCLALKPIGEGAAP